MTVIENLLSGLFEQARPGTVSHVEAFVDLTSPVSEVLAHLRALRDCDEPVVVRKGVGALYLWGACESGSGVVVTAMIWKG